MKVLSKAKEIDAFVLEHHKCETLNMKRKQLFYGEKVFNKSTQKGLTKVFESSFKYLQSVIYGRILWRVIEGREKVEKDGKH
jgi:hypothetical protein